MITLSKFAKVPTKTFKNMVDRFRKLVADVRAIYPSQVPSEINLMAVLKKTIESVGSFRI